MVDKQGRNLDEIMPDEELLYDLADLFKIFGDTTYKNTVRTS